MLVVCVYCSCDNEQAEAREQWNRTRNMMMAVQCSLGTLVINKLERRRRRAKNPAVVPGHAQL
jgi:hypothetical protein